MNIIEAITDAFYLLFAGDRALWHIVRVSISISMMALLICTLPAILFAYILATRQNRLYRWLIVLMQSLLAFPTVVIGLLLYMLFSQQGPLGGWNILFTPKIMVVGQVLIAFPILTVFALSAFQGQILLIRETVQGLGANFFHTVWSICYEVRFGLLCALLIAFGRVISEVGCALIVGGNIASKTRTIPTAITLKAGVGEFEQGIALGIVLVALALGVSILASLGAPRNH